MRFHEKNHPRRKLSGKELAARVDSLALIQPSLRQAIAKVAKSEGITQNAVRWAHRDYGRPIVELALERKALRVKWAADPDEEWRSKGFLEQTMPKPPGRRRSKK